MFFNLEGHDSEQWAERDASGPSFSAIGRIRGGGGRDFGGSGIEPFHGGRVGFCDPTWSFLSSSCCSIVCTRFDPIVTLSWLLKAENKVRVPLPRSILLLFVVQPSNFVGSVSSFFSFSG